MQSSFRRTLLLTLAIVVAVLIFALTIRPSMSLRGVPGPTLGLAEAPMLAIAWVAACFALCVVVACVAGRLINAVVGMFVLGCGVAILALRSGTVQDLVFSPVQLTSVAAETFAWALVILVASVIVFRASGPLPDALPIDDPRVDGALGVKGLLAQLAGAIVLVGVLLIDVTSAKGQALGAVVVGCLLAGLVGRLIAPRTPPVLMFAAPVIFGGIGHLVAHFLVPAGTALDHAYVSGTLSRLAYPMPIDYAAGSLVGIALGIGWSRSFVKTEVVGSRDVAAAHGSGRA